MVPQGKHRKAWLAIKIISLQIGATLWLFNIAMEAMAHRNRWFTY